MKNIFITFTLVFVGIQLFAQNNYQVNYTLIQSNGGRHDFSKQNNKIAFDRPDTNGYYNIYLTDTTGSDLVNITNKPFAPQKHNGTPVWHPNGEWIVFTSQIESVPNIFDNVGGPGIGVFNNLWVTDTLGSQFHQLTNYTYSFPAQGVLHPIFSHDGTKILWAHLINDNLGLHGHWVIHLADFVIGTGGIPELQNIQTLTPGVSQYNLYETSSFSITDDTIYFASPMNNTSFYDWDIYSYDLNTNVLTNLTNSIGVWDEHAHVSPDGNKIIWGSSQGYNLDTTALDSLRTDWWIMNLDGSNKTQLTHFNTQGFPEYSPERRGCMDLSWGKDNNQFYGLVQTEIAGIGSIVKIDIDVLLNIVSFNEKTELIAYPNPITNGMLTLETGRVIESPLISVHNLMGQKVFESRYNSNDIFLLQLENLETGIYYLSVIARQETILNNILIIK